MNKIDVILSFDLEFSAGGAFTYPDLLKPLGRDYVWLKQGGQSLGLGYVLETLEKHNLRAVFYAETCNAAYHGLDEMGEIVKKVSEAGHDIQLHVHPAWMQAPHDRKKLRNDSLANMGTQEIVDILEFSIDVFKKWQNKKPLSIRAGSLHISRNFYEAVSQVGIPSSSSIGYPIYKSTEIELQKKLGVYKINGVIETPVSTIESRFLNRNFYRPFQITACSTSEMTHSLEYAYNKSISPIIILSHHFEFVKSSNFRFDNFAPNNLVRRRLEELCLFLSSNSNYFNVTTMHDWLTINNKNPFIENKIECGLKVSFPKAAKRMLENKTNEIITKFKIMKIK